MTTSSAPRAPGSQKRAPISASSSAAAAEIAVHEFSGGGVHMVMTALHIAATKSTVKISAVHGMKLSPRVSHTPSACIGTAESSCFLGGLLSTRTDGRIDHTAPITKRPKTTVIMMNARDALTINVSFRKQSIVVVAD